MLRDIAGLCAQVAAKHGIPKAGLLITAMRKAGWEDASKTVSYLASCSVSSNEAPDWLSIVNEKHQKRQIAAEVQELNRRLQQVPEDTSVIDMLSDAQSSLVRAVSSHGQKTIYSLGETLDKVHDQWSQVQAGTSETVEPTGIEALTRSIKGLRKKDIVVVGGRPSQMKSCLALTIARTYARRQKHSLILSLEQSKEQMAMRIASAHKGINTRSWDEVMEPSEAKKVNEALTELHSAPIDFSEVRGCTIPKIEALARYEKARCSDLELIVVDYIQLMRLDLSRQSKTAALGEVVNRLRDLAGELDVTVIAISQLNREVERSPTKRPTMSDFRESGEIEEVADVVLLMYWPAKYWPDEYGRAGLEEYGEIIVGKGRQSGGAGARCVVKFDGAHARITDCAAEQRKRYLDYMAANKRL